MSSRLLPLTRLEPAIRVVWFFWLCWKLCLLFYYNQTCLHPAKIIIWKYRISVVLASNAVSVISCELKGSFTWHIGLYTEIIVSAPWVCIQSWPVTFFTNLITGLMDATAVHSSEKLLVYRDGRAAQDSDCIQHHSSAPVCMWPLRFAEAAGCGYMRILQYHHRNMLYSDRLQPFQMFYLVILKYRSS